MSEPQLIHKAIISIMRDVEAIKKDRRNDGQNYKFRGIDDIFNEVHPKFAQHGVFITPQVLEHAREERQTSKGGNLIYSVLKIRFQFFAEDGSSVCCDTIGEGMDSGDKASNKAMSVAMKYAIMQILLIPTEDPKDPENDSSTVAPKVEVPKDPKKDEGNREYKLRDTGPKMSHTKGLVTKKWEDEEGNLWVDFKTPKGEAPVLCDPETYDACKVDHEIHLGIKYNDKKQLVAVDYFPY